MDIKITVYDHSKEYDKLLDIIRSEGEEWKDYFGRSYQRVLKNSITYVAYMDDTLCGYARSVNDNGFYIWVVDLLVDKKYRGNAIGQKLMERLSADFPDQDVFVMSDVDEYYGKLGYKREGSIFRVKKEGTA